MFLKQMGIVVSEDKLKVDIQKVCMDRKTIKKWAYILHDKDDTRPHYHIYLNFGNSSINTLDVAKWFDLDKIVYSNGKIPGKPAPDIYQIAAKNIGLTPKECIVIEDAVSGINSAYAAGIGKIIAIASVEENSLYEAIPCVSQIIRHFSEIDKSIFKNLL